MLERITGNAWHASKKCYTAGRFVSVAFSAVVHPRGYLKEEYGIADREYGAAYTGLGLSSGWDHSTETEDLNAKVHQFAERMRHIKFIASLFGVNVEHS